MCDQCGKFVWWGRPWGSQGRDGVRRHTEGGQQFWAPRALGTWRVVRVRPRRQAGQFWRVWCWVQSRTLSSGAIIGVFRKVARLDLFLRKEIVYHLKRGPEAGEATRKVLQWSRRWTVRAFTEVMTIGVKKLEQHMWKRSVGGTEPIMIRNSAAFKRWRKRSWGWFVRHHWGQGVEKLGVSGDAVR